MFVFLTKKTLTFGIYLASCYIVLQGVDSQTKDIIIMAHVESLGVLLPVVHNSNGSYMVDYLPCLGVEQVASAVVAPVTAMYKVIFWAKDNWHSWK